MQRDPASSMKLLLKGGRVFLFASLFLFGSLSGAPAQDQSGLSRTMQQGIQLYEKGKDQEALDRFIEVLSNGSSDERNLASDYITKINMRMASGEAGTPPAAPSAVQSAAAAQPTALAGSVPAPVAAALPLTAPAAAVPSPAYQPPAPAPASVLQQSLQPSLNRGPAAMRKEIAAKLLSKRKELLARLKKRSGVQVSLAEDGKADAIALASALLFDQEVNFRIPQSVDVLQMVSGLAFLTGDAQLLIWPERFQSGQPSLVDMRRAVALRNYFLAAGLSPARVQVNLVGGTANPPQGLFGFAGPVVQFRYNQELKLTRQSTGLTEEGGPLVSLGAYPERFVPADQDGALIEFSILEGDNGVSSWRFQILPAKNPEKAAPVQELTGDGAALHQVFWNGHFDYYGDRMPYGSYPCILTAQDYKGNQATARLLLVLEPPRSMSYVHPVRSAGRKTAMTRKTHAAPARRATRKKSAKKHAKHLKAAKTARKKSHAHRKAATAKPTAASAASSDEGFKSGSVSQVQFEENSTQLSPNGEQDMDKAADAIKLYPLAKKVITGYAFKGEDNPSALAEKRAQVVKDLLASKYNVDVSLVSVAAKVTDDDSPRVEIGLEPNGD